jgi:hypothetical protein
MSVAISVSEDAAAQDAFARDFPALASRKSEQDLFFANMAKFAELDKQYRFQLTDSEDANGNREVFDWRTGTLICAPTSEDRGMEALRKLALYQHAYNEALSHRSAVAELRRNLACEQSDREHAEFAKLMAYCGRDENGDKTAERLEKEDQMRKLFRWGVK